MQILQLPPTTSRSELDLQNSQPVNWKAGLMILEINPWICLFPGVAIFFTVLAFNLFGDGLRDVLDPRLKM
jgi:ABC-type dipeptide/oligopeptide/nickel transport system permease subunit